MLASYNLLRLLHNVIAIKFDWHLTLQVLTTQQKILELDLSNLLSSCDFTENVLRYGNEAEIMLVKPQMVSRLQNLNDHESQCEPEDNEVIHMFTLQISALCFPGLVVICQRDLNSSSKPYKSSNQTDMFPWGCCSLHSFILPILFLHSQIRKRHH